MDHGSFFKTQLHVLFELQGEVNSALIFVGAPTHVHQKSLNLLVHLLIMMLMDQMDKFIVIL